MRYCFQGISRHCMLGYEKKRRWRARWIVRAAVSTFLIVLLLDAETSYAQDQSAQPRPGDTTEARKLRQQNKLNVALQARLQALQERASMDECAILREQGDKACLAPRPLIEFNRPVIQRPRSGAPGTDPTLEAPPRGTQAPENTSESKSDNPDGAATAAQTPSGLDALDKVAPAKALSRSSLVDMLEKTTVFVLTRKATGTGFFVAPGLVLTNRHVISDETEILITSATLGRPYRVRTIKQSPLPTEPGQIDFALLRVDGLADTPLVTIGVATQKLSSVTAAGYPGLVIGNDEAFKALTSGNLAAAPDLVLSRGETSSIQQIGASNAETVVHTARIMSGNSGGPLTDACGRVVGINTFTAADSNRASSAGFALGPATIRSFLQGVAGVRYAKPGLCEN
jgi:serine protease Do